MNRRRRFKAKRRRRERKLFDRLSRTLYVARFTVTSGFDEATLQACAPKLAIIKS